MTPKKQYYEIAARTIISNLEKRQMEGYYCEDSDAAIKMVLEFLPEGSLISWGGTMTLEETKVLDAVKKGNFSLLDRAQAKTAQEKKDIYRKAFSADYYFMSSNAITMDGQLINVDGNGNRLACLCYGPEHVILLVGMNKVVPAVEEGIKRVHNVAAPMNALRLHKNTPCANTGKCFDCQSPDCLCCQTVITRRSNTPGRIKVILIGEELGY